MACCVDDEVVGTVWQGGVSAARSQSLHSTSTLLPAYCLTAGKVHLGYGGHALDLVL